MCVNGSDNEDGEAEEEAEEEKPAAAKNVNDTKRKREAAEEEAKDAEVMKTALMFKKARRLHGRMLHGIAKKDENVAKLVSKRKELDAKAVAVTGGASAKKKAVSKVKK
jgi:hypothetical protein